MMTTDANLPFAASVQHAALEAGRIALRVRIPPGGNGTGWTGQMRTADQANRAVVQATAAGVDTWAHHAEAFFTRLLALPEDAEWDLSDSLTDTAAVLIAWHAALNPPRQRG